MLFNSDRSSRFLRAILGSAVLVGWAIALPLSRAEDKPAPGPEQGAAKGDSQETAEEKALREKRERYLAWMKEYAGKTEVLTPVAADGSQPKATPVPQPIFRYSDEEHRIPDATLWCWTHNNRPVAFQKVEGNNFGGGRQWTVCFASLSEGLITVHWPEGRKHAMTKPGLVFRPIPEAEAPSPNPRLRSVQIRAMKDRFSSRMGNSDGSSNSESRTIPKPLFEYADPDTKLPIGAAFGMTSTGTNPNVILVIEARTTATGETRWEYAHARMTGSSVQFRYDDQILWTEKGTSSGDKGNWIYFFLARSFE